MSPAGISRRALVAATAVLGAGVLASCAADGLSRPQTVGRTGVTVVLAADPAGRRAMTGEISQFVRADRRVETITGTPTAVAGGIKDGRPVDVVVLPAGTTFDRVRDELLDPPLSIGSLDGVPYVAAAVTTRGRPFLTQVRSPRGAALLRAAGLR